ncbi:MAG TPA: hypothetical protein VM163_13190 [bacterium]|nr:hypothetical protein [bacterium]
MNLLQAIEHTKWQILSMFVEFGFTPARVMSQFDQDELYHLFRARRNKPCVLLERLNSAIATRPAARKIGRHTEGREFPHDVRPLSTQETAEMVRLSQLLVTARGKRGRKLTQRERIFLWDDERRSACLGADVLARRSSMDDYLWAVYQHCSSRGIKLSVEACRHIYHTKLLVAPLFSGRILRPKHAEAPCYLCVPDAPEESQANGSEAREMFDTVFGRLRARTELGRATRWGLEHEAS